MGKSRNLSVSSIFYLTGLITTTLHLVWLSIYVTIKDGIFELEHGLYLPEKEKKSWWEKNVEKSGNHF